jgi:mannose-6-phosphate isomerase-like protein (cupin superfamily)
VWNISDITHDNKSFRKVLYTWDQVQLVAMCLQPWEDTGSDKHENQDVVIRVEKWDAIVDVDWFEYKLDNNMAIVVPVWSKQITKNISKEKKLYIHIMYCRPYHPDNKIHITKADAEKDRPVTKKTVASVKPVTVKSSPKK